MKKKWRDILLKVMDGASDIPSPYDDTAAMRYLFVMLDSKSKMGYLWIWCAKTHYGIRISRLKIPEGVTCYNSGELEGLDVPAIHFVDPH